MLRPRSHAEAVQKNAGSAPLEMFLLSPVFQKFCLMPDVSSRPAFAWRSVANASLRIAGALDSTGHSPLSRVLSCSPQYENRATFEGDGGRRICKAMGEQRRGDEPQIGAWLWHARRCKKARGTTAKRGNTSAPLRCAKPSGALHEAATAQHR
jgi:hypothetical protein